MGSINPFQIVRLADKYANLLSQITSYEIAEDGEIPEEFAVMIDVNEIALLSEIDGFVGMLRSLKQYQKVCEEEAAYQSNRAAQFERKLDFLKSLLMQSMRIIGQPKITTALSSVSICSNGGLLPLKIRSVEELPSEFVRTITTNHPKQEEIRKALAAGKTLPGVTFEPRGSHLRIAGLK